MKKIKIYLIILIAFCVPASAIDRSSGDFIELPPFFVGFLNEDINGSYCFIGLEGWDGYSYSGPFSNTFFSEDQKNLMLECAENSDAENKIIFAEELTLEEKRHPNMKGVTIHYPRYKVTCESVDDLVFEVIKNKWISSIKKSNFKTCPN